MIFWIVHSLKTILWLQKEEKKQEVKAPPPPVLHAKKDRSSSQKCKKKEPEIETLIHTDNKKDTKATVVVQGTQNTRIKDAQPQVKIVKQDISEKESLMVPKEETRRDRNVEVKQCKTETKSNVPWYLQD